MGRPPLPVGTYGKITTVPISGGRQRARCKFRDYDGQVRLVERTGKTKLSAQNALKEALRDRQGPTNGHITRDTKLVDLATAWLSEVDANTDLAVDTRQMYRRAVRNYVLPSVGSLRIGEVTVAPLDRALTAIRDKHGPSAAKTARSVLSGMFGLAARHDATTVNPVRDTSPIRIQQKRARALTESEANYLLEQLRASDRANALDLPDLVEFMLATGCRIGEACAARYRANAEGKPLLDLEAGTWEVNATIVRQDGVGLIIQERPKSIAGWRVLALPPSAVKMLRRRAGELRLLAPHGIVFGSPSAKALRDPSNTPGDLREVIDAIDCPACHGAGRVPSGQSGSRRCPEAGPFAWVHSHTFRKTVATRLDDAGCTPREVADQLGHSKPSMTMDVYMGRNVVSAKAASLLDRSGTHA